MIRLVFAILDVTFLPKIVVNRLVLSIITVFLFTNSGVAGNLQKDSTISFLPKQKIFPVIFLDPLECQVSGGSYFLSRSESNLSLYSNVCLGLNKPILKVNGKKFTSEAAFGAATFTQFDLVKKDNGSYLAGLLNNDYKVSLEYSIKSKQNLFKIRVFHVSSHLGDDYMLRHNDTIPNDKSVNYEQGDITYLKLYHKSYWYLSVGEIYTKYLFRKRFSCFTGYLLEFKDYRTFSFFTALNVKFFAENNFQPDCRASIGINCKRENEPIVRIWFEYYNGHLPYSTLDYGRVNWFGFAMWINVL